jgi:hypothetical protein
MTRYERQYRSIARTLSPHELTARAHGDEVGLEATELLNKDAGRRFLDYYGDEGLRVAFERYGLMAAIRRRGYDDLEIANRATDERHTLIVSGRATHPKGSDTRHRLVELAVRRDRLVPYPIPGVSPLEQAFDVLTVDWLLLQDPLRAFTRERPQLPGQEAPGLGVGERVLELLYRTAERLGLDGVATVPEYLHNALLYSREMAFFDPGPAGRLRALEDLLIEQEGLTIAQASWAMEWGLVRGPDDASVKWKGELLVTAFAPALRAWLYSDEHIQAEARSAESGRYVLDRTWFDEKWAEHTKAAAR